MPALKKGLSGLEPYEGKLSRTVLRGGSGGNITLLPGEQVLNSSFPSFFGSINAKYFAFFLGKIYLSISRTAPILFVFLSHSRYGKPSSINLPLLDEMAKVEVYIPEQFG
jgi:hypothetical protein